MPRMFILGKWKFESHVFSYSANGSLFATHFHTWRMEVWMLRIFILGKKIFCTIQTQLEHFMRDLRFVLPWKLQLWVMIPCNLVHGSPGSASKVKATCSDERAVFICYPVRFHNPEVQYMNLNVDCKDNYHWNVKFVVRNIILPAPRSSSCQLSSFPTRNGDDAADQ